MPLSSPYFYYVLKTTKSIQYFITYTVNYLNMSLELLLYLSILTKSSTLEVSPDCPAPSVFDGELCRIDYKINQWPGECPYLENSPYWRYSSQIPSWDQPEFLPIKLDPVSGYFRYVDKSKFYQDLAYANEYEGSLPVEESDPPMCLAYTKRENKIEALDCSGLSRTCYYENTKELTMCEAYEKICFENEEIPLESDCYCYSQYTKNHFCR